MTTALPPEIPGLDLVQRLGSGGYADVYLYRQELPRMLVAVKVLRSADGQQQQALVAEANTMAQLAEHPYIVSVLRAGVIDDRPYLVMSYYPRPTLAERARQSVLPVGEALRTGIQLASAVETAHRAGVLHRDIKPANVLVTSYGAPALADFGIAGLVHDVDDDDDIGVSVAWAPPEVLSGESNGSVAADVYSLAATLHCLLTGMAPFEDVGGDNSGDALYARAVHEPPRRTGRVDVPESLERLLSQAMAKDPTRRPASSLALALDLQVVEQELRLPRTEVTLLDAVGEPPERSTLSSATRRRPSIASGGLSGGAPDTDINGSSGGASGTGSGEPDLAPRARRARRGWVGGAIAVGAASLLALAGSAAWWANRGGDDPPPPAASSTSVEQSDPAVPPTTPAGTVATTPTTGGESAGGIDPCLVGSWRSTRHEESIGPLSLDGIERRVVVDADGGYTVSYDRSTTADGDITLDGEIDYRARSGDGRLTFTVVRVDATMTASGVSGPVTPGTGAVDYTCSGDDFVQTAAGFRSEYRREVE